MEPWLLYLATGLFAGLVAGLLGVGGGLIIVPAFALLFQLQGMAPGHLMHLAIGSSLATIIFTSLSSVYAHHRRGAVQWPLVWVLAPGILLGAFAGGWVAEAIPSQGLRYLFAGFEFWVAAQMWFGLKPAPHRQLPPAAGVMGTGGGIGVVSALLGIGGGSLTVPFLVWCNTPMRQAVATSAACGLPIAVAGALGFLLAGWGNPALPSMSLGYLYLPAILGVVVASVLAAPLGAYLAHRIAPQQLKRLFALFLAGLGLKMVLG